MNEGQDVRLFRFSKSEDGTIKGSHKDLQNLDYWQVGCMGITAPCSEVFFFKFYPFLPKEIPRYVQKNKSISQLTKELNLVAKWQIFFL